MYPNVCSHVQFLGRLSSSHSYLTRRSRTLDSNTCSWVWNSATFLVTSVTILRSSWQPRSHSTIYTFLMGNQISSSKRTITQGHVTTGDQSSESNDMVPVTASTRGGFLHGAQNLIISDSQFTEVHGNYVCDCLPCVKVSIVIVILRKSIITLLLLLILCYHLCHLWSIQAPYSQVVIYI